MRGNSQLFSSSPSLWQDRKESWHTCGGRRDFGLSFFLLLSSTPFKFHFCHSTEDESGPGAHDLPVMTTGRRGWHLFELDSERAEGSLLPHLSFYNNPKALEICALVWFLWEDFM